MVFAGVGLAVLFSFGALAIASAYRKIKPLPDAPPPREIKYTLGLAGDDRYVEGDLGQVLSAYETRMVQRWSTGRTPRSGW